MKASPVAGALTVVALVATAGCCRIAGPSPDDRPAPREVDPAPQPSDIDLGLGVFPTSAPSVNPAQYRFLVPPLDSATYRAGYALGSDEHKAIRKSLFDYADSVSFRQVSKDRFSWSPPPGCRSDMHCVMEAIAARNMPALRPLAERFRARAKAAKLNALETAELVVAFVQNIHYEVPTEPFGILPPALVASEKRGDCDSKSLLALLLLHALGIEGVITESDAHQHAMLGVPLPTQGTTFEYGGRRYAFTECTARGWPIGQIEPRLLHPNDWHAFAVHVDDAGVKVNPLPAPSPSTSSRPWRKRK